MDLKWLEDFISIANTGNFSKSAEQRNVTQPTFSRRIRSLEDWLGAPLIDRGSYPARLTDAGHAFRETAEEAIQMLHQARADFRNEQAARRAALSFSALHTIALTFFPAWISELKSELGLGSTRMSAGNLHECVESFVNGNCDFLICYAHEAVPVLLDPIKFPSHVLAEERLVPVCAAGEDGEPLFSLNAGGDLTIPYLSYSNENFLGRIAEYVVESSKLERRLEIVHEDPMAESLKRMAMEGNGIGWLPRSAIAPELEDGSLLRCGDPSFDINLDISIFRSLRPRSPERHATVVIRDVPLRRRTRARWRHGSMRSTHKQYRFSIRHSSPRCRFMAAQADSVLPRLWVGGTRTNWGSTGRLVTPAPETGRPTTGRPAPISTSLSEPVRRSWGEDAMSETQSESEKHPDPLTPTAKGGPFGFWTSLKLWQKILVALVLGVIVGAVLGPYAEYIKPIGSLFINLIKMLIVPLIFSSLVVGICSMDDIKKMGRIGAKSFGIYLLTTAIAITIGLIMGTILQPGAGLNMQMPAELTAAAKEAPSFIQTCSTWCQRTRSRRCRPARFCRLSSLR